MTRWTPSRDRVLRTDLRITHRLGLNDLAMLLAAITEGIDDDEIAALPATEVRTMIREALEYRGRDTALDGQATAVHLAVAARAFNITVQGRPY